MRTGAPICHLKEYHLSWERNVIPLSKGSVSFHRQFSYASWVWMLAC